MTLNQIDVYLTVANNRTSNQNWCLFNCRK